MSVLLTAPTATQANFLDAIKGNPTEKGKAAATGVQFHSGGTGLLYSWCDNDHLLVQLEGRRTYLLDIRDFKVRPIELFDENGKVLRVPVPAQQDCRSGQLLATKPNKTTEAAKESQRQILEHYVGPLSGGQAQLLVAPTERVIAVNFKAKYILAEKPKRRTADGYRTLDECATYYQPGYRLVCVDTDSGFREHYALERFILAPYVWDEAVMVRDESGGLQSVRNQRPLRRDEKGKPIRYAIDLRNLDFGLAATLTDDPVFKLDTLFLTLSSDEQYAYAPCAKRAESKPEGHSDFYAVCKYHLDGKQNHWQQVFYSDEIKKNRMQIQRIDVGAEGDIYFAPRGRPKHIPVWRYEARSGKVAQLTRGTPYNGDDAPKSSPDTKTVAFIRRSGNSHLFIIRGEEK